MERRRTACPLDCPDHCTVRAMVEAGPDGTRLVSLDGDERNPLTGGFICAKVRNFANHLYGDDRIRTPLRRRGDRFEPISWDEALSRITDELIEVRDAFGGEAILPFSYGGSNGALTEGIVDRRLFRRLGASRLARTVCAAPSGRAQAGLYGCMPGVAFADYPHSRLIVLWGVNPSASGIHLVPLIKRAQRAGAKLVVIDPRRTPLARSADMHLPVRPGTDLPLALAVAHWLFEHGRADRDFLREHATGVEAFADRTHEWTVPRTAEVTGLTADRIEAFSRLFADTSPAVIRCGWGPERNRNGGSAIASILALPAIGGKFGVRGGGYTMSNSRLMPLPVDPLVGEPSPPTREINMNRLGRALGPKMSPPVRLLFVYDCNPLATMPDQVGVRRGLRRSDLFTVVFDQVMTDTAREADIVLPATTFLEHDELRTGYGAPVVVRGRPIVSRVGEARTNYEVFGELIERLGLGRAGDVTEPEALASELLARLDRPHATAIERDGATSHVATTPFVDFFPRTPDRKVHLVPDDLDREAPRGLYAYRPVPDEDAFGLTLISPATRHTISSTFGQLDRRPATLLMHPDDAVVRGLLDGARVRVYNRQGEAHVRMQTSDEIRAGVVFLPKGLWCRSTENGNTANALAPDHLTDLGHGATFNDARVEVQELASPASRTSI